MPHACALHLRCQPHPAAILASRGVYAGAVMVNGCVQRCLNGWGFHRMLPGLDERAGLLARRITSVVGLGIVPYFIDCNLEII